MVALESRIEARACRRVWLELGVPNAKLAMVADSGWPDRIFFLRGGRILLIEFKDSDKALDPQQVYIHKFLKENGYDVEVCWTVDQAFEAIKSRQGGQAALATARLPKESRKVPNRTRRSGSVPGAGAG